MDVFVLVAFFLVGALAGTIGGLLGLSGGIVTVPCLILLFHLLEFPQDYLVHTAIGTSLAAMVLNGTTSTWAHSRRSGVMWHTVFTMLPGLFLGCMLGALAAHFISGILLQVIFGLFVSLLGAYVLFQKKPSKAKGSQDNRTMYSWVGLGIGGVSSMLGLGGGVFTVPFLLYHGNPEKKAIGTSAAVGLVITLFSAVAYIYFGLKVEDVPYSIGYIYLPAFALVGLASIFFAPLGVKLAHQMNGKKLRKMFAAVLILVGILMIFN